MLSRPIFSKSSAWSRWLVFAVAAAAVAEERLGAVEELLLPLTDLDGVDLVRLREFGDGRVLPAGVQEVIPRELGSQLGDWTESGQGFSGPPVRSGGERREGDLDDGP